LIDDVKTIEKSKRVQWDQQAEYRQLFRHPQIWERQAAIACRGRSACCIPAYSISASAHKRTKNPIFTGAIITEEVFGYPGIGSLLVDAVHAGDYSLVLGVTSVSIVAVSTAVLVIDLLYPLLDPRVQVE
jgi:hypothetical protein